MEKLLTISIAAYNMEPYLHRTLDSVCLPELLEELEVLVINDGSTDRTAEIAREYEARYPGTVRLINKENGGYGTTVNRGVKEAKGKFFRLLDGDDFFDPEAFLSYFRKLKVTTSDLVITFVAKADEDGNYTGTRIQSWQIHLGERLRPSQLKTFVLCGMWSITVLTEKIRENLPVLPKHTLYTDQLFVFAAMAGAEEIEFCEEAVYVYRLGRDGQSVGTESLRKHYRDEMKVLRRLLHLYGTSPLVTEENRFLLLSRVRYYYYFGFQTVCILDRSAAHFRLLMSMEKTAREKYPDVYEDAAKNSRKVRLMRSSGGLLYLLTAGNDKFWRG